MRKLTLFMRVSLDGYTSRPNGELDFLFPTVTPAHLEWVTRSLREVDTFLVGRVGYLGMAAYWPSQSGELADLLNTREKIVFSKTLDNLEWNNSRLAGHDIAEEIAQLKRQPGKNIVVLGGATIAQAVLRLGLVDEISLVIHPVVLGTGKPLFVEELHLKLLETITFDSGAVHHAYQPIKTAEAQS